MASAYASLVSLVHVLIRVQHPSCPASFDQLQIQSLLDKVNSLIDFLEAYSHKITDDFGRKMVHAAYAAEPLKRSGENHPGNGSHHPGSHANVDDNELGDQLHKCLFGRRYLIILDDIWDVKAWDEINRFCPDNNNKSRILLTTRISDIGRSVGSCSSFDINLLDDDKSWELFSEKVFGEEACPPELEECGRTISRGCKGLPLAIVVIGGMLKASGKTRENWEDVAENINSIIGGEDGEHCLKILSLSYHQLPIHLKPCFLYLATYPYDYDIRVPELIKLWVADGFLRPNVGDVTLEEVALKYLEELGNRNLIMIKKLNFEGTMKCLSIHDLVMDLCMREAQTEKFLFVDSCGEVLLETIESHRRVVNHCFSDYASMQPNGFSRSYISLGTSDPSYISQLRMLRSCFMFGGNGSEYLLSPPVNLRLISLTDKDCFQKVSMLWNLETLIAYSADDYFEVPSEIWNLRHIKHLIFSNRVILPDPPSSNADFVLQNLQTLC